MRYKGSHTFWEVKVKEEVQNLILFCTRLKGAEVKLETFIVSFKVDTSIPAVEILGFKAKLPLELDKVSLSFREFHLIVS